MACKYQNICVYELKKTNYICVPGGPEISQKGCLFYERFEEAQKPEFQALVASKLEELLLQHRLDNS